MAKDLIKQDMNFLEYHLWVQDERIPEDKEKGHVWEDREGYVYRCFYKPPSKLDYIFLLYLLSVCQERGYPETMRVSRHDILKHCGKDASIESYERLRDSIRRWTHVKLEFSKGKFYIKKDEYLDSIIFGVIDSSGTFESAEETWIRFSPEWLTRIKNSEAFKYLDFRVVKALETGLNIRLYEILLKNFQGRDVWEIDAMKLAGKIPLKVKYAAHAVPKFKASVAAINEKTQLQVAMETQNIAKGKVKCIFTRRREESSLDRLIEDESFHKLIDLMPTQYRGELDVQLMVARALERHGYQFVYDRILYTNRRPKVRDYVKYLRTMLSKETLDGKIEGGEQQRIAFEAARRKRDANQAIATREKERQERAALDAEHKLFGRATHYMNKLSPADYEKVKIEAMKRMDAKQLADLKKGEDYASTMLTHHMAQVVIDEGRVK